MARKGIVNGRIVIETGADKGIVSGAILTETIPTAEASAPAYLGIANNRMVVRTGERLSLEFLDTLSTDSSPRTVIVAGRIYEITGERNVTINGVRFEETAPYVDDANTTIAVPTGSLSLSGEAPTAVTTGGVDHTADPDVGALSLTGQAPTVVTTNNLVVSPGTGSLTVTGISPTIDVTTGADVTETPGTGALDITGYVPDVVLTAHHIRGPPTGELTLTGYIPTPTFVVGIPIDKGSLTLTGYAPVVINGFIVTDVDGDESVFDGQTGVVVSLAGEGISATGKRVFIHDGATWVEQTVTGEDASSVTITVSFGGLSEGAATLCVWDPV